MFLRGHDLRGLTRQFTEGFAGGLQPSRTLRLSYDAKQTLEIAQKQWGFTGVQMSY